MTESGPAAAVILAAGRGRRLGGAAKALLRGPDGVSFLASVASRARAAGARELVVVAGGPHRAPTEIEAARLGLAIAVNPDAERGMGSSVALGFAFAAARFGAPAALLWPVDYPRISPETVAAIGAAAAPGVVAAPRYQGRGGHPVAVGRDFWPALARSQRAPGGARAIVGRRACAPRREIDTNDPEVAADVDTPADRERLAGARAGGGSAAL